MRFTLALVLIAPAAFAADSGPAGSGWPAYGGDAGGTRYSALKQVTPRECREPQSRSGRITPAHSSPKQQLNQKAAFEATPILVDGTLYLTTPFNRVIALDPAAAPRSGPMIPR